MDGFMKSTVAERRRSALARRRLAVSTVAMVWLKRAAGMNTSSAPFIIFWW